MRPHVDDVRSGCAALAAALLSAPSARVSTRLQGGVRPWRAYVPGHEDLAAAGVSEAEALRQLRTRLRGAARASARRLERAARENEELAARQRDRAAALHALADGRAVA